MAVTRSRYGLASASGVPDGGNLDILDEFAGGFAAPAIRYIDTDSGNDSNDGTSLVTAWKTGDRAISEIPNVSGSSGGYYILLVSGSAGLSLPKEIGLEKFTDLNIYFVPDTTAVSPILSIPAGTVSGATVPLPGTPSGVKAAVLEYSITPWGTPLTDAGHYLIGEFGSPVVYFGAGALHGDASDEVAGTLRVGTSFDWAAFLTLKVFPRTATIAANSGPPATPEFRMICKNHNIQIHVMGFEFPNALREVRIDGIRTEGSYFANQNNVYVAGFEGGNQGMFAPTGTSYIEKSKVGQGQSVNGLIDSATFKTGLTLLEGTHSLYGLTFKDAAFTNWFLRLGGNTGYPYGGVSADLDYSDFEGGGTIDGIYLKDGAQIRTSNFATGITFDDIRQAFTVRRKSFAQFSGGRLFGTCRLPSDCLSGSIVEGPVATSPTNKLANTVNAGHDVNVGNDGRNPAAWPDLPRSDLGMGDLSEGVIVK